MVVINRAVSIFDFEGFLDYGLLFSQIYDFLLEFCIYKYPFDIFIKI